MGQGSISKALSGLWLSFSEKEVADIWQSVAEDGYEPNTEGLKMWILDQARMPAEPETSTDRVLKHVEQYIRAHPEEIKKYGGIGAFAIRNIFRKMGVQL